MKMSLPAQAPTMESVRGQFEAWRASRTKGASIPPALWEAAVDLCGRHNSSTVARVLRLNAAELKDRVQRSTDGVETSPAFVNLPFTAARAYPTWVIEMENRHGERLSMHLNGEAGIDVIALGKAFWGRTP